MKMTVVQWKRYPQHFGERSVKLVALDSEYNQYELYIKACQEYYDEITNPHQRLILPSAA